MPDVDRDNLLDDLSAYLDGELSQGRAAEVERLLAESPEARGMLAELRQVRAQVRALPVRRAPVELSAALRGQAVQRAVWPARVLRLGVPLAMAAAAVLAIGVYLRQPGRPQARTAPPEVAKRTAMPSVAPATPEPSPPLAAAVPEREPEARTPEVAREKLESLGWADATVRAAGQQPALAIALEPHVGEVQPGVESQPLALAIYPRTDAEHAKFAALLASWSPTESSSTNGQAVEYVYQLALPDVSQRVAQLLDVQTAAEEAGPAGRGPAAQPASPPAAAQPGEKKEPAVAERRGVAAGGRGGGPGQAGPRRPIIGEQREAAARFKRLHAQHQAVTEEPEIIVINAPGAASAPASRPAGSETRDAAANERLLELLIKGELPTWAAAPPASAPGAASQASARQVELRIELVPAVAPGARSGGPTSGRSQ